MRAVGIILIIVGVLALAYQGITYTTHKTHKKVLDLGPIQATREEHKTIPIPPILGAIALIGGIAILATGRRNGA